MKNYLEISKSSNENVRMLVKSGSETMQAMKNVAAATVKDGKLSVKTKEMIALALGIAARCDGCIAHHVQAAMKTGMTREELLEVIGVCQMMGGGPSTVYGADALSAFDQFSGGTAK